MDNYIDSRFERVERALATLTDSIHKYTPQSSQSLELAAADRSLNDGLRLLQTHQNNHTRLAALKAQSETLDNQIRDTLRLLWTTRRDISSTHVTTFPKDQPRYEVNWEELLGYARRISKTTLPAPSVLAAAAAAAAATAAANGTGGENSVPSTGEAVNTPITTAAQTPAPGGATPAMANGGGTPAPQSQSLPQSSESQQQATQTTNGTALPDEWTRFLDPLTDTAFQPWPTEEKIRGGALASLQGLLQQGIDPRGFDPAEEEARRLREEEERRVQEEKEAREREENLRRMREEQARVARERHQERERAQEEAMRRGSMIGSMGYAGGGGPSPTTAQPAQRQFQFMDLDDDDDD